MNKKYKKPNLLTYFIFRLASKMISKFKFNLKVTENEIKNKKGPFVILANHEAAIDFLTITSAIKTRMHFVISNSFYQTLSIQPLLKAVGVIPKQQFQTAIADMKKMKAVIDNNMPLVIYPAGLMTESGITTPIPGGNGKCVKWLNADVYVAYTEGSYLTSPKWSDKKRKGKIRLSIKKLFSKEELQEANPDDLQAKIEQAIYFDSYKNQEKNMDKFKNGNNIEGLENVLYQCPKCLSLHQMVIVDKTNLVCKTCGNKAIADDYGFLNKATENDVVFKHPSDWVRMINSNLAKKMNDNNDNIVLNDQCEIHLINYKKHCFYKAGKGNISLDKDKFTLIGSLNNEDINLELSVINFPILPFKPGKYFELQNGKEIYRIYLKDSFKTTEWIYTLQYYHQKKLH